MGVFYNPEGAEDLFPCPPEISTLNLALLTVYHGFENWKMRAAIFSAGVRPSVVMASSNAAVTPSTVSSSFIIVMFARSKSASKTIALDAPGTLDHSFHFGRHIAWVDPSIHGGHEDRVFGFPVRAKRDRYLIMASWRSFRPASFAGTNGYPKRPWSAPKKK